MIWNNKISARRQVANQIYDILIEEKLIESMEYRRPEIVEIIEEEISDFTIYKPQKVSSNLLLRLSFLAWLPMFFIFILFLPFKWLFTGALKFETTGRLKWFINWHDKIMKHRN